MVDPFRTRSPNGSDSQSERFGLTVRTVRTHSPNGSDSQSESLGLSFFCRLTILVDYFRSYLRYGLTPVKNYF